MGGAPICFPFQGNGSQLLLGPLLHPKSTKHRGSGGFLPAPRPPTAAGSAPQAPGCQTLAWNRGAGSSLAPSWVCAISAGGTPGPSSFCPRGKRRPFPLPRARRTGLRSGKLGSECTSGGGAQRPTPNTDGVSGSCATGQARPRTSDGHDCAQHAVTSWIKGSGIQAALSN